MATYRKLPSGRWQAKVKKDGKYVPVGMFITKKEAELYATEIERKLYYNEIIPDRKMKFQEVIDDWYRHKKLSLKDSTLEQLEVIKRLHIEPSFAHKIVFDVGREDIMDWINEYEAIENEDGEPKYSYGSRLKFLITLKDILNHAVYTMEVLSKNPATKVQLPMQGRLAIRQEIKYYSLTELNFLLEFLYEYNPPRFPEYKPYYMLVYFLSRTGLRISEALALKWDDIDGNRLMINKQTSRDNNNNLGMSTLKTESSYRNIELDDETVELLMDFRKTQQKMVLKYPKFTRNENLIVFQTYNGNYMTPSTVRETLKGYCTTAGVAYKGTHGFRHTHAVLALEAGADLLYISRRLGHGSIQTTADTYLDVTPQYESRELTKISDFLNSKLHESCTTDNNAN